MRVSPRSGRRIGRTCRPLRGLTYVEINHSWGLRPRLYALARFRGLTGLVDNDPNSNSEVVLRWPITEFSRVVVKLERANVEPFVRANV